MNTLNIEKFCNTRNSVRRMLTQPASYALAATATAAGFALASAAALAVPQGTTGTLSVVSSTSAGRPVGGDDTANYHGNCGVSADGNWVVFNSLASTLVANDSNNFNDVFLKNVRTGAVTRVNTTSSGAQFSTGANCVTLTPDARLVLFRANGNTLYLKNVQTGTLTQVTPPANTFPFNQGFDGGSVSDDGNKVSFFTIPTAIGDGAYNYINVVPKRIVVRDLRTNGLTVLATDNGNTRTGEVTGGGLLSPDGTKVVFSSTYGGLVPNDNNGQADVFVQDLTTGVTQLVSGDASGPVPTSPDSLFLTYIAPAFVSNDLVRYDINVATSLGSAGTYLKSLSSKVITQVMPAAEGVGAQFSGDGTRIVFRQKNAGSFTYRATVRDLLTGAESIASSSSQGVIGNGNTLSAQISRDGKTAVFLSLSTNLVAPAPQERFQVYAKALPAR
jgi:Tol biopolymer transport system component